MKRVRFLVWSAFATIATLASLVSSTSFASLEHKQTPTQRKAIRAKILTKRSALHKQRESQLGQLEARMGRIQSKSGKKLLLNESKPLRSKQQAIRVKGNIKYLTIDKNGRGKTGLKNKPRPQSLRRGPADDGTAINVAGTADTYTAEVNQVVNFDGGQSRDPDGDPVVTYEWDFGDGTSSSPSTSPTDTHSYAAVGTYIVTLTVTDDNGTTGSISFDETIVDEVPPVAVASANTYTSEVDEAIQFVGGNSYDADGDAITDFLWDFGDGSPRVSIDNTAHAYTNAGKYTVSLTVWDTDGYSDTTSFEVIIDDEAPPIAIATSDVILTEVGDSIRVDGSQSRDPDGDAITGHIWDFGDGTPLVGGEIATHQYQNPGTYTVTLTVTDADGLSDSDSISIVVGDVPPVTNLSAVVGRRSVQFFWNPGSSDSAYVIDYAQGDGSNLSCHPSIAKNIGTATSFNYTGLLSGTEYSFLICAYNPAGFYSVGEIITVTTGSQLPVTINKFVLSGNSAQISFKSQEANRSYQLFESRGSVNAPLQAVPGVSPSSGIIRSTSANQTLFFTAPRTDGNVFFTVQTLNY